MNEDLDLQISLTYKEKENRSHILAEIEKKQ